jgi:D-glycero-D-manno-heptose 1,7-bisphosphate phosphatase
VDRDGVINVNRDDHVKRWEEFNFLPGAYDGLASLAEMGKRIFVVTNQASVGRGVITEGELQGIHDRMVAEIERHSGSVEAVLACPHRPEDHCGCRKPEPGMLLEAQRQFAIDLGASVFVGDHESDAIAAHRAGCRCILVRSGRPGFDRTDIPGVIARCDDLVSAAAVIRQLATESEGLTSRGTAAL